MQTFIPFPDIKKSAAVLDYRRLGKQRVEVLQLLQTKEGEAWFNHPAARMWRNYKSSLSYYGNVICDEWLRRGYKDTCKKKINLIQLPEWIEPHWWNSEIHISHQSNLKRKNPLIYDFDVPNNLPYYWPI